MKSKTTGKSIAISTAAFPLRRCCLQLRSVDGALMLLQADRDLTAQCERLRKSRILQHRKVGLLRGYQRVYAGFVAVGTRRVAGDRRQRAGHRAGAELAWGRCCRD